MIFRATEIGYQIKFFFCNKATRRLVFEKNLKWPYALAYFAAGLVTKKIFVALVLINRPVNVDCYNFKLLSFLIKYDFKCKDSSLLTLRYNSWYHCSNGENNLA
jgi:hypothetical protein